MRYRNLLRPCDRHGFRDARITGPGMLPTRFGNASRLLCRLDDGHGGLPLLGRAPCRYLLVSDK